MDSLQPSRDSIGDQSPRDSSMFVSSSAGDRLCPPIPTMEMDGRFMNWKAHAQQAPNCPRCASANTKFCYYNNYSLAQPRYFCKGCRRYWTKGGSLRNVPVGTGCRKTTRRRSRLKQQLITARNSPDSDKIDDQWHTATSSPEIDLADVFARYLNRVEPSVSQGHHGPESPPPTAQDCQRANLENATEQGQQYLFEQGWQQEGDNNATCTMGLEPFDHGFVLQTEDVFRSTTEDGSSPNWDPMLVQPLAPFYASVLDDQFCSVSTNSLISDINWSCFDLPWYGD